MSRADQQASYLALLDVWLRQVLKSECTELEWQNALVRFPFAVANSNSFTCIPCVGIDQTEAVDFDIFPNPAIDVFFLMGISNEAEWLRIFAMDASMVLEERISGRKQISISQNLDNGVYLVQLFGKKGKITEKKMVIVK